MNYTQKIVKIAFSCGATRQYRVSTLVKIPYFNYIFSNPNEKERIGRGNTYYLPILHTTFTKVLDFAETRNTDCIESDSDYIVLIELLIIFQFLTKNEAIDRISTRITGGCIGSTETKLSTSSHSPDSNKTFRRDSSNGRRDIGLSDLYIPRWEPLDTTILNYKTVVVNVRGKNMMVPYLLLNKHCTKYFSNLNNPVHDESYSEDRCLEIHREVECDNFIDMEPEHLGYLIEYLLFPGLSQLPNNFDIYCQNVIGFKPDVPMRNNLLNQRLKLFN